MHFILMDLMDLSIEINYARQLHGSLKFKILLNILLIENYYN